MIVAYGGEKNTHLANTGLAMPAKWSHLLYPW